MNDVKLHYFKSHRGKRNYAYIYLGVYLGRSRYQLYHRYVIEQHLGRKLEKDEHIHHLNGNGRDNRIENLELLNIRDHYIKHNPYGTNPKKNLSKDILIELRSKGLSIMKIGEKFKMGKSSVYRRLEEYGFA